MQRMYLLRMDFGSRIKKARKASKLTQNQLGELCGITKSAVSQWEKNLTEPKLRAIAKLCDRSGYSADFIVRGIEQSPIPRDVLELAKKIMAMADSKRDLLLEIFERHVEDEKVSRHIPPAPAEKQRVNK